jgi:hypothetical protein
VDFLIGAPRFRDDDEKAFEPPRHEGHQAILLKSKSILRMTG